MTAVDLLGRPETLQAAKAQFAIDMGRQASRQD